MSGEGEITGLEGRGRLALDPDVLARVDRGYHTAGNVGGIARNVREGSETGYIVEVDHIPLRSVEVVDDGCARKILDDEHVCSGTAEQIVNASDPGSASGQEVVPRLAEQHVGARTAIQGIIAVAAVDIIVAVAAISGVVPVL